MTLIDLLMTITVIGIVIAAIAPTLAPQNPVRLIAAGALVVSDIEYAQSATLANPADPTVVRFDTKGLGYWLALESDPDQPIMRPGTTDEYRITFGEGLAASLDGISVDAASIPDFTVTFDAFGRLSTPGNQSVIVYTGDTCVIIEITDTTGSVRLSGEQPLPAK